LAKKDRNRLVIESECKTKFNRVVKKLGTLSGSVSFNLPKFLYLGF